MTGKATRAEDLGIDVAEVEDALQRNRGLPPHTYYDPNVYEFEAKAIFSNSWQYFAPLDQLSTEGDVVAGLVGNSSVVVTRAKDGELHGFLNICRHRGYPVVEKEQSRCRVLRCAYHSWSYDLTGNLVGAPDTESETHFDKSDSSLFPVAVDTWGSLVFVNPDPNAAPLRVTHPHMTQWVAEEGLDDSSDRYTYRVGLEVNQGSNWKLWQDNNYECYHCLTLHSESLSKAFATKDGDYSLRYTDRMTISHYKGFEPENSDDLSGGDQLVLHFFPGCSIVQQNDLMLVLQVIPTGPESCCVRQHYFIDKGVPEDRFNRWVDLYKQTFNEDGEAAEKQQRNLRTNVGGFQFVYKREEHSVRMLAYTWNAYKAALA
ncbi:hypothetical protein NOR51B_1118 [Luminiphilus syltensis NOR5-1B]|uniref:Rieske domain-containing protein n=1 Tax=Luminiphilus syltensis NOR5-1B TaxID=565045 RepID=B8KY57_9GAMM|nr:aromatic ring-hydroxylating dioxygenase subunit alpha [Luminiphilus syltensis]EED35173.1 hypothetical protein NOR51B_1118 [Luminiphilus syltensis NOR5-1B]